MVEIQEVFLGKATAALRLETGVALAPWCKSGGTRQLAEEAAGVKDPSGKHSALPGPRQGSLGIPGREFLS